MDKKGVRPASNIIVDFEQVDALQQQESRKLSAQTFQKSMIFKQLKLYTYIIL